MPRGNRTGGLTRQLMLGVIILCAVLWWFTARAYILPRYGGAEKGHPDRQPVPTGISRKVKPVSSEDWMWCASEGEECMCQTAVRYGAGNGWTERTICDHDLRWICSNNAFNGADPVPGVVKACYCLDPTVPLPPSMPCLGSDCVDLLSDCGSRATAGGCSASGPGSLRKLCKKACGFCGPVASPPPRNRDRTKPQTLQQAEDAGIHAQAIIYQVRKMQGEPHVDPEALRRAEELKYPGLKGRPNPMKTGCSLRGDDTEKMLRKVQISPPQQGPKIMCLVYTMEGKTEALDAIRDTYAPHCDGFLAMSTATHPETQQLRVHHKGKEEYQNMWQKSRSIWAYVAEEEKTRPHFDYFVIGGDDLYVLVDNLRAYLGSSEIVAAGKNGTAPLFLGRRFKDRVGIIFNSGGAGYVLNRAALLLLYSRMDSRECHPDLTAFSEDREVALCLKGAGVYPYDTKDSKHEERFMPFSPDLHYNYHAKNYKTDWYKDYTIDLKEGLEAMSTQAVSFHYLKPPAMRRVHSLLYHCLSGGASPWLL